MANDLNIQGEVVMSTEQVEAAFDRVGDRAGKMAAEVANSANNASKAVDGIGNGADSGVEKFTRKQARFRDEIQRSTLELQILGKTASEKFQVLADAKGLNAAQFAPYIAELKKAEEAQRIASGSLDKMGMSAAATANAMRMVPAQFTDIVVSLQAGQAPLTVLLQQGGQLKDMFGGVGAAVKGMATYVTGLVNPFTIAAAAVAVLGLAYYQGSKEADAYRSALILTGNAAGTTVSQLSAYAREISGVVGTQAAAAESLAAMAGSGKIAGDVLKESALAAVEYERATGTAVTKTAEKFASLANEPLSAVLKLNEGTNFLTISVYKQIKSLEEQGKAADATAVAQRAYADSLTGRSTEILNNLGSIERAWLAIKDGAKAGWDAMLGIGREKTTGDKLASVRSEIAAVENRIASGASTAGTGGFAGLQLQSGEAKRALDFDNARLHSLQAQAAALEGVAYQERQNSEQKAESVKQTQMLTQWDKEGDQFRTKAAKREEEINKAKAEGQSLIAAGLLTEAGLRQRISDISEKYKDGKKSGVAGVGESEVAQIKARTEAQKQYLALLESQGAQADKLTEGEKLVIKIKNELQTSISGVARAQKLNALAAAEEQAAVDRQVEGEKKRITELEKSKAAYASLIDDTHKSALALQQHAGELAASNEVYGKGKTAVEEYRLALIKAKITEAEGSNSFDPAYIAALYEKLTAQTNVVTQIRISEFKQISEHADELLANAQAMAIAYKDEAALSGLTSVERAKIVALRQVELRYAKELDRIDKMEPGANRDAARATVEYAKRIEGEAAVSKAIQDDWTKTTDQINQSLTDALLRGFEAGKSFAENLRDTLKNMFNTLVLRPIISAIMTPVSGVINGVVQMGMGAIGLGGGGNNLISTGSNLYSAYNTGSSLYTVGSQYFAGSMSAANAGGTIFANSVGGGLDALLATNGAYGTAAGSSMGMGAFSGAGIGAAIVMAAAYLGGMFKSEKQVGAGITGELGGDLYGYQLMREGGSLFSGPSYRYIVAEKELEKARAEIEQLKVNPNLETDGNLTYRMKYLRERVEMLEGKYGSSIEASKGPVDILQQSYSDIREAVATQADSLGLDGDAVRKMKTSLGLDEIHPDTGGLGIELSGLTEEEATAKVKAALEKANEDLARSVLGSMQEVTREVTRTYADSTTIQDADGNVYEDRVWHDVTETVTTMEWVMSEYVRSGETAVDALNRISGSLVGVNNVFELLGADLLSASLASGDWASKLIESMGGIDNLNAAAGGYYDRYYSDDEKRTRQISTANSGMEELGFGLRAGDDNAMQKYRDLVDGAIAAKDEVLLASLLKFAEQFGLGVDAVVSATQVHLDELKKAQEAAEELKQKALAATGLSVDSMVSGFMEQVNSGRGAQAGVWLADTIAVGFEQAIYGQALSVIMNSIIDGVVTPVVTAAMTGSTVSAAISGAAIDTMVANATAAAAALATLMNDPAFKEAMAKTLDVLKDLGNSIGSTIPKMSTYKAAQTSVATSYDYTTSAAESAADAAKKLADQWKSTVESMSDEMKRLRGELLGESDDQGMAYYEGLFAIKTAQARAGDQDAADELPSIIQALEALAKGSAGSKSEVLLMQSAWLDSLGYTRDFLASKYGVDIGNEQSSVTGATTAATVIKGSANTAVLGALQSSSDNPALLAELKALRAEVAALRDDQRALGEAQLLPLKDIATSNKRMQVLQEMEGT